MVGFGYEERSIDAISKKHNFVSAKYKDLTGIDKVNGVSWSELGVAYASHLSLPKPSFTSSGTPIICPGSSLMVFYAKANATKPMYFYIFNEHKDLVLAGIGDKVRKSLNDEYGVDGYARIIITLGMDDFVDFLYNGIDIIFSPISYENTSRIGATSNRRVTGMIKSYHYGSRIVEWYMSTANTLLLDGPHKVNYGGLCTDVVPIDNLSTGRTDALLFRLEGKVVNIPPLYDVRIICYDFFSGREEKGSGLKVYRGDKVIYEDVKDVYYIGNSIDVVELNSGKCIAVGRSRYFDLVIDKGCNAVERYAVFEWEDEVYVVLLTVDGKIYTYVFDGADQLYPEEVMTGFDKFAVGDNTHLYFKGDRTFVIDNKHNPLEIIDAFTAGVFPDQNDYVMNTNGECVVMN